MFPLYSYLTLAFGYALKYWHSYTSLSAITLPESTESLIESIFAALEYKHGYILVSHALGYITCSGNIGLSENELEDILSCDEEVLQDVFQWWTPPIRRLPPLLWSRIRNELGPFLGKTIVISILLGHYSHANIDFSL